MRRAPTAARIADVDITHIVLMYVTLIISLTVHEAAHALLALLGGDRTAYYSGQVTLNPIPHMRREPFGMIVLPLLGLMTSGMCIGYAHTPIDERWAWNHPRKAALMSAAGPVSNLLLAALAFAILKFGGRSANDTTEAIRTIAFAFLYLNLLLAVFNFLPMPPLDGAGIVQGLWPRTRRFYDGVTRLPYAGLVIFVAMIVVLPKVFTPIFATVRSWL